MVTARATPSVSEVLDAHRDAAVPSTAAGVGSAVFDTGPSQTRSSGAVAVVCLHGVPTSSFLYRHVLAELARRGVRGVAFDLPGLGLADRPADVDYWDASRRQPSTNSGWSASTCWCTTSGARSGSSSRPRNPTGSRR